LAQKYFWGLVRDLVLLAILMRDCKKGAYKQIEEMLKQYGLTDDDVYLDRNSRSVISAEAFILTVIAGNKLRDPGQSAEQFS